MLGVIHKGDYMMNKKTVSIISILVLSLCLTNCLTPPRTGSPRPSTQVYNSWFILWKPGPETVKHFELVYPGAIVLSVLEINLFSKPIRIPIILRFLSKPRQKGSDGSEEPVDYVQLIAELTEAINENPGDSQLYYARGMVYADKGDYDLAIADLEKIEATSPDYANALFLKGIVYTDAENYAEAIAALNAVLAISPDNIDVIYSLGLAYFENSQAEEALPKFQRVYDLDPEYADITSVLAELQI
jgi:tetratricopeptide (TPR) repeat protein